jgi:hypothetical protein
VPRSEKIRVWAHDEFFQRRSDLPTFHSSAIEANLAFLPELAEHFLSFNDDMLLMDRVSWTDFFGPDGRMHVFFEARRLVPPWARVLVERSSLHTRKLLTTVRAFARARPRSARSLGGPLRRFPRELHQPAPSRRSVLESLWDDASFGPLVRATSAARFRDEHALEVVYLQRLVALDTGKGMIASPPSHLEISLTKEREARARAFARAVSERPRLLCLHDNLPDDDSVVALVESEIRALLRGAAGSTSTSEPGRDGFSSERV